MTTFLTSLFESIFTPGPTPSLLIATNAAFGSLQLLLLILLITTQSVHFIVLSVLCGGLWYAINWFAAEVSAVKVEEDRKKAAEGEGTGTGTGTGTEKEGLGEGGKIKDKERERRRAEKSMSPEPGAGGSDTETEDQGVGVGTGREVKGRDTTGRLRKAPPKGLSDVHASENPDVASDLLRPDAPDSAPKDTSDSGLLPRRRSLGDSSGYVSTDSEWEKVDDDEAKK